VAIHGLPASRSHFLYSVREPEVGSPSNTALAIPSKCVITLTFNQRRIRLIRRGSPTRCCTNWRSQLWSRLPK
jgi:hypothetical protein